MAYPPPQPVRKVITIASGGKQKHNAWSCMVEDPYYSVYSVTFQTKNPASSQIVKRPFTITKKSKDTEVEVIISWAEPRTPQSTFVIPLDGVTKQTYNVPDSPITQVTSLHKSWLNQGGDGTWVASLEMVDADCTVVDFKTWDKDLASKKAIGKQVVAGLAKSGFIYVTNHGLDKLINQAMGHAKHFFDQVVSRREEVRQISAFRERIRSPPMKTMRGYSDIREEALNPTMGKDIKESFDFGLAADGESTCQTHVGINKWPEEGESQVAAAGFKTTSMAYIQAGYGLAQIVLHSIALGLGLPGDRFDEYFKSPLVVNRYLKYPPQQDYSPYPQEMGAGSHVDFGAVTLIYSTTPGLEILGQHNQWKAVKAIPDAFIVNTGYIMEKLTNGAIPATKHRVVNRQSDTRYSFALFLDPNPSVTLGPMKEFVDEQHPAKYDQCQSGHKGVMFTYN